MPIYAYRCESCGHAKDVLQKISDPVLSTCPACHAPTFKKQLTAAGFQLKGSGWYVTDFRGGNSGATAKPDAAPDAAPAESGKADTAKTDGAKADAPKTDGAKSEAAAAPAAPTGGCGTSCACH